MLADVPLWFAGLTAALPIAGGLVTLHLSNRHNHRLRELDSADHVADRVHSQRIEVDRELRAERRDLYRRLIVSAKRVLDIDQSMVEKTTRVLQRLAREQEGAGSSVADILDGWKPFDEWRSLVAEAEFLGSEEVVASVRAVGERAQMLTQRATELRVKATATSEPVEFDPDAEDAIVAESRRIIAVLADACAADLGARTSARATSP